MPRLAVFVVVVVGILFVCSMGAFRVVLVVLSPKIQPFHLTP